MMSIIDWTKEYLVQVGSSRASQSTRDNSTKLLSLESRRNGALDQPLQSRAWFIVLRNFSLSQRDIENMSL